ncbi:uncharacterized protein LOC142620784 [Castanea sativa]|uniref:uncharacterized protein LOC142620784 n=1 Tax=Castanea sativa TaxID=21020 RepID=UPI003F65072E
MGKTLLQISHSPFTKRIEQAELPRHFNQPSFTIYNGKMDPIKYVFPSSLNPVVMRWFDGPEEGSINSYEELTRAFKARFVTCSQVPRPLDSLLSMSMREEETLKNYFDRYWELYNEIDWDFEDVAIRTFKVGLPTHSNFWKFLTMKPP